MAKEIYTVLGLGLFGTSLARTLARNGKDVIAIDSNMELVENIVEEVSYAVQGDFSKFETLAEAGVGESSTVIIASSARFENTISTILSLQRLNVPKIVAKTRKEEYKQVLLKLGVDKVILPEADMGVWIGNELSSGTDTVLDLIELDSKSHIVEFTAREKWVGKSISEIDFRSQYHMNLIAIRSVGADSFDVTLQPDYRFQIGDLIVGLTNNLEAKNLLEHHR